MTSKVLGIGSAEKSWSKVKDIKAGHCTHVSDANAEMRLIVYSTARINDARTTVIYGATKRYETMKIIEIRPIDQYCFFSNTHLSF